MPAGRAASVVVSALETCWHQLRRDIPDLPAGVIVLAGRGRHPLNGYCEPGRWLVDGSGAPRAEILIVGESLHRGAVPVFGTLVHEACHVLAHARGIRDTSRQGRYHNKRFKALAAELGIEVGYDTSRGWSETTVPRGTVFRYRRQVDGLAAALRLVRRADGPTPPRQTSAAVTCACITLRGAEGAVTAWLEAGPTTCASRGQPFTRKGSG
jgi:hypothetical protein